MIIRSFLAFDIPPKLKAELASAIDLLSPKIKGIKWVEPSRMHCTIRFFGYVEEELLIGKLSEVIESEVRHQAPIHLEGHGLGIFPNWRYPRVIWAGLIGETDSMISLHAKLEEAFLQFGFKKDPRALRLHLTLGRAKSALKDKESLVGMVEKMAEHEFSSFDINELVLYKSELTREGPIYTALRRFPLGGREKK
jgi:2'-5' RNA ligase